MADTLDRCRSVRQTAAYLGVGTRKILEAIRSGALAASDLSGSPARPLYRITPEALSAYLAARAATAETPRPQRRARRPAGWVDRY